MRGALYCAQKPKVPHRGATGKREGDGEVGTLENFNRGIGRKDGTYFLLKRIFFHHRPLSVKLHPAKRNKVKKIKKKKQDKGRKPLFSWQNTN